MTLDEFLVHVNEKKPLIGGSEIHEFMVKMSQEARKITTELNTSYHGKFVIYFQSSPERLLILHL